MSTAGLRHFLKISLGVLSTFILLSTSMSAVQAAKPACAGKPTITSIVPSSGDVSGGTTVNIAGECFEDGLSVDFSNTAGVVVSVTPNLIVVKSPSHAAGAVDVGVKHSTGNAQVKNGFTFTEVVGPKTIKVTYDSQGGSPIEPTSIVVGGSISAGPIDPAWYGHTFLGWSTTTNGATISFPYPAPNTSDFTLYAIWKVNDPTPYTVTFNGNGADGGSTAPQTSSVPAYLSPNGFTRAGFTWHGWMTSPTGGVEYELDTLYPFSANTVLYAEWSADVIPPVTPPVTPPASSGGGYRPPTYKVTFDENDGVGEMNSASLSTNSKLPEITFERPGYNFDHWSTVRSVDGTLIDNQGTFPLSADTILYAHWQPKIAISVKANEPINLPIKGDEAVAIAVNVQVSNYSVITAVVDIPKGVATISSAIRITPLASNASVATGIVNMRVEIFDAKGKLFPTLLEPIRIHFQNVQGDLTIATSNDSLHWSPIPLLSSRTLPAGQADGYYTDSQNTIDVITNHLTMFSMKRQVTNILKAKASSNSVSLYRNSQLRTSGTSGASAVYYKSNSPYICDVDGAGKIIPLQTGTCQLVAVQDSDGIYFDSVSKPIKVKVTHTNWKVNVTGDGDIHRIGLALTSEYANKLTHIEVLKPGETKFKVVNHIILNDKGKNSFNLAIEPNSVIRVLVDGAVVTTYLYNK